MARSTAGGTARRAGGPGRPASGINRPPAGAEWRVRLQGRVALITGGDGAGGPGGRRLQTPEEIARVVRFVVSEDAAMITGSMLVVDGGAVLL